MVRRFEPITHYLKTVEPYFTQVRIENKTYEVRKNDRDFQRGDVLCLQEYDPKNQSFTGGQVLRVVSHVLHGGQFGIKKGHCILGLKTLEVEHGQE